MTEEAYNFASEHELDGACDAGESWIRGARRRYNWSPPPPERLEAEEEWFGSLAASALLTSRMLARVRSNGDISLSPGEAREVFMRFHLFSEVVQLLQNRSYSWVNALDSYGKPVWAGRPVAVEFREPEPTSGLGEQASACREHLDALLSCFVRNASVTVVGPLLSRLFCLLAALAAALERAISRDS